MSTYAELGLQDSASPLMEQLMYFHDHSMFIITITTITVGYMILSLMMNKYIDRHVMDGQYLEILWTILPAIVLIFIALPSLRILYLIDENSNPTLTLKTIGHQWYWSYEYSDFMNIEFNSYMTPQNELELFNIRLLEVDNRTTLPMNTLTRILITSEDVIHSWTIPSIGVKADATPGRLNQATFWFNRPGVFYGQCSEICGTNHSFMPIVIESTLTNDFLKWIFNISE
uniref:Cytochrome c oxidase subunit 2 n=1 Tax=Parasphendale agrionina TaxID=766989 RepID=A0A977KDL7_9NEOP|nr:cytochrome c oxidase subunit II [Parasphendale agrionina]ASY97939.1 cytochrome c oxidase subunit II [Parasphendale agrionina]UXD78615.1 cytochrome c oxidase subunit II [Parasphendale agrionina]